MNRGLTLRAASFAIVAVVAFGAGILLGGNSKAESLVSHLPFIGNGLDSTPDTSADLSPFWQAWNALNANFVETHASSTMPDDTKKIQGAIAGLAASYGDPYTVYFPPEQAKAFNENISGNFGGVGMEIDIKNGVLTVIAPLKGTPAEKAGVKAGDQIIAINGKSTEGESVDAAVAAIRGPVGSTVTVTLVQGGKATDVTIVRDTIQVPESDDKLDASGVYRIALYEFTANSAQLFDQAFARFKQSGAKSLVIDLRGDPGGYLDAAVDIASHFLPKGATIVTEDFKGKQQNDAHTSLGYNDVPAGTKVVVLIDQGSASASEILAGALQSNKIATLIGTNSFGKGSVQQLMNLDGGSLKVTVARWLTPSGKNISDGGLAPDIQSTLATSTPPATAGTAQDTQWQRAIKFLTTGK
jgi:carboxyl-terminal processing protease